MRDLRYALRFLARTPAFTIPAVVSLALGIAVNTTMFSIVNGLLLKPMVEGVSGLVFIGRSLRGDGSFRSVSFDEFSYLREHARSFSGLAGAQLESMAVAGPDGAEPISAGIVAGDYFGMLEAPVLAGRTFTRDEHSSREPRAVAVISDRFWRRRFGGDRSVLGATVVVNNVPLAIVGVAGQRVDGSVVDLWIPMAMTHAVMHRTDPFPPSMGVLARLKEGVSAASAREELRFLARRMSEENPARDRNRGLELGPARGIHPGIANAITPVLILLMAVVGVVLLIACANVAGALLARASARRRELAVRLALGAGRGRVVRQLLVESLVLAGAGGAAGLALAVWPVQLLYAAIPRVGPLEAFGGFQVDGRVLLFTAVTTTATALIFGLLPALQATRIDLVSGLRASASVFGRSRLRGALLVVQVALSFVLLVAAGLLFRSLHNTTVLDVGFMPDRLVVASFRDLRSFGFDRPRTDTFHREWLERVRQLRGVERAAAASFVALGSGGGPDRPLRVPGATAGPQEEDLTIRAGEVSDQYFTTIGQPLLAGRDFTPADGPGSTRVAIVNDAMARRFWRGGDAVGRRIQMGEELAEYQIVGVVRNAAYASGTALVEPFVFLPSTAPPTLHVRTSRPPAQILKDVERTAYAIEPSLPPYVGETMRDAMDESLGPIRFVQLVITVAGTIALLLAAGGLYGLVCFTLESRLKEVGIRIALGATRASVLRVIVGGVTRLTGIGVLIGAALAVATTRLMSSLLYGLSPTDPATFAGTASVLVVVTIAAGYLAMRQGVRQDPVALLRPE